MSKRDDENKSRALRAMSDVWTLARVLREHSHSSTAQHAHDDLDDRDILIVKLVAGFPGKVTATTVCKVWDIHYSHAGQIVNRLAGLGVLKKPGRSKPLELGPSAEKIVQQIELKQAAGFMFLCEAFEPKDFEVMADLLGKIHKTAHQRVLDRVFGEYPMQNF